MPVGTIPKLGCCGGASYCVAEIRFEIEDGRTLPANMTTTVPPPPGWYNFPAVTWFESSVISTYLSRAISEATALVAIPGVSGDGKYIRRVYHVTCNSALVNSTGGTTDPLTFSETADPDQILPELPGDPAYACNAEPYQSGVVWASNGYLRGPFSGQYLYCNSLIVEARVHAFRLTDTEICLWTRRDGWFINEAPECEAPEIVGGKILTPPSTNTDQYYDPTNITAITSRDWLVDQQSQYFWRFASTNSSGVIYPGNTIGSTVGPPDCCGWSVVAGAEGSIITGPSGEIIGT